MKEKKTIAKIKKKEHILVCLSSSPSNPKVIKTASKMAEVFDANFTALFIETSGSKNITKENKKRLEKNIKLAKQNNANIVTLSGDDIARQVSFYAQTSGVTKIVIGRSGYRANRFFSPPNFVDKLIEFSPDIEIHVIPDKMQKIYLGQKHTKKRFEMPIISLKDTLKSFAILTAATFIGEVFHRININEANIIMIYILGVLLTAYVTEGKIYSLISSFLAVLIFNFFFTDPHLSLMSTDTGYPITFLIMFLVAFFISSITKKIKSQALQSSLKAYRTEVMLEMSQKLQKALRKEEITEITIEQIKKLLDCEVAIFEQEQKSKETKDSLFPICSSNNFFGTVKTEKKDISEFEKNLLIAMLREAALTYEKERIIQSKNELLLRHKQEELRSTLLRAISHDLRTPLTGISGNAELLMSNSSKLSSEKKQQIYTDIYDDSIWLLNLIENLLSITRFDSQEITIKKESEFISDVIEEALSHLGKRKDYYKIQTNIENDTLSAVVDARLISQVIFNLTDNAMKYSPKGSTIIVGAEKQDKHINVYVADNGNGICLKDKQKIFDMFYTVNNSVADGRRGLGIGLALCKAIVEAHGGKLSVSDNKPQGSIFSFNLTGDFYE